MNIIDSLHDWKKSVIHLECATDSVDVFQRFDLISQFRESSENHNIEGERRLSDELEQFRNNIRSQGTAFYIEHNNKHYIITARHVLFDERQYLANEREQQNSFPDSSPREKTCVFKEIYRVPSLSELSNCNAHDRINEIIHSGFLSLVSSGAYELSTYILSQEELDIGIIQLDRYYPNVIQGLKKFGFIPLPSSVISEEDFGEGHDVFTVGFPGSSIVGQLDLCNPYRQWMPSAVSEHVYTWGRVAMNHNDLPSFWCDMTIYPGNSGGPVIHDGKIIGLVSGQPTIPIEGSPELRTRIPFAHIIKGRHIMNTLRALEEKIANNYGS